MCQVVTCVKCQVVTCVLDHSISTFVKIGGTRRKSNRKSRRTIDYSVSLAVLAMQGWVGLNADWLQGKEARAMCNGRTCGTCNGRMCVLAQTISILVLIRKIAQRN
jgi:hypothetical protein